MGLPTRHRPTRAHVVGGWAVRNRPTWSRRLLVVIARFSTRQGDLVRFLLTTFSTRPPAD